MQFGMGNTLLSFQDDYYEHSGSVDPEMRGLTIGGYESAWLADLVAAWILNRTKSLFRRTSEYHGTHRDDGITIFKGKWNYKQIDDWMKTFQFKVNDSCGNKDLQFTTSIWNLDEKNTSNHEEKEEKIYKYNDAIKIYGRDHFPFLDLQLKWNNNDELKFKVCVKENQKLKYLNSDSTHTKSCMKAIPFGLFKRLTKLTSINNVR